MTWKMMRVFRCSLCGREEPSGSGMLHPTWNGNDCETGDCYCPECWGKLQEVSGCRFLRLDGDPHRVVCNQCGTTFDTNALSIDGNTPPDRCPSCNRQVIK